MARYRKHTIQRDDTINSIAQKYSNNPNFWRDIVNYNELEYPYIVYTDEEKLKNPESWVTLGNTIIIPIEQHPGDIDLGALGKQDEDLITNLTLGSDLLMASDKPLIQFGGGSDNVFNLTANGRGDVALARGLDNIKQATIARLLTRRGSLLLHPNYGSELHEIIGRPATSLTQDQLDNEIQRVIQQDERIIGVTLNHSNIDNQVYTGDFTVSLRSLESSFDLLVEAEQGSYVIR